jgi:hypothetical protein
MPSTDALGHLACYFPLLGMRGEFCVHIVADKGTETVVFLGIVGIGREVELGEEWLGERGRVGGSHIRCCGCVC